MIERIGNYRILDEIGSGGMAVVYRGIQESLERTVAIKALKTSMSDDENVVARFEREATSLASFAHENIITLYDFFRERGALFMVMEFVEGIDLYDLFERCPRLPVDVTAIFGLQVARALDYAHFRGVIHRDVKPANVIVSRLGEVKLTDFGIARTEQSDLTEAGIGLGTPAYMSPEQILGEKLDHRSDIWSLGVLLYQSLSGNKPFVEDEQRSVMQAIRLEEPKPLREVNPAVPKDLERIVVKCMQKSPGDRYDSTQAVVIALEQFLAVHVDGNYRARMVVFLREQDVISSDETLATLNPALIAGGNYTGSIKSRRGRRRRVAGFLFGLGLAGGVAGGVALTDYAPDWMRRDRPQTQEQVCAQLPPASDHDGFLRVLAQPWAQVEIDGEVKDTTPHMPIALEPGPHKVKLTNSYGFEPHESEITIESGKVKTITVVLKPRGAVMPDTH